MTEEISQDQAAKIAADKIAAAKAKNPKPAAKVSNAPKKPYVPKPKPAGFNPYVIPRMTGILPPGAPSPVIAYKRTKPRKIFSGPNANVKLTAAKK